MLKNDLNKNTISNSKIDSKKSSLRKVKIFKLNFKINQINYQLVEKYLKKSLIKNKIS